MDIFSIACLRQIFFRHKYAMDFATDIFSVVDFGTNFATDYIFRHKFCDENLFVAKFIANLETKIFHCKFPTENVIHCKVRHKIAMTNFRC